MATTRWHVSSRGRCQAVTRCASSFVCPPLRSKPQTFGIKIPLHFQTFCWPRPPPPTAAVTFVATSAKLLMRLLAGGSTASMLSDPLDHLNPEI
eukprot:322291-Chlamydomonas_euryale.AAC.1